MPSQSLSRASVSTKHHSVSCQFAIRSNSRNVLLSGWRFPGEKNGIEFGVSPSLPVESELYFPRPLTFFPPRETDPSDLIMEMKWYWQEVSHSKLFLSSSIPFQNGTEQITIKISNSCAQLNSILTDPCTVSFRYFWPVVTAPPRALRNCLDSLGVFTDRSHPMTVDIIPYMILTHFTRNGIGSFNPSQIAEMFPTVENSRQYLLGWIQSNFIPELPIVALYLTRLKSSLGELGVWPDPFFIILLKCIFLESGFQLADLDSFFDEAARQNSLPLIRAVCRFILQLGVIRTSQPKRAFRYGDSWPFINGQLTQFPGIERRTF
jgi:hypothetical protein